MDVATLVTLYDQQARNEVEHRLYFTQRQKPDGSGSNMVESTRTVIYATDPLKNISYPFECIMTVPTDPPSNKVQLIGGFFFANGKLYSFPGMETPEIVIDLNQDTYVLTGVKIDPKTDRTDLYVQVTHGEYPFMDRDMVPSALIKIPQGFTDIISGYIMDLRPFIHYNVSTPEDRAILDLSCINPNESVTFELMRNRRLPPIMNFYKKLPPTGTHTITHSFNKQEDVITLGDYEPVIDSSLGARLPKTITAKPISMVDAPNVLFVSALNGNDFGDGTSAYPLLTLGAAIDRYNGMPQYDTIFITEGIYYISGITKQLNRSVTIIGESPTLVHIRIMDNQQPMITTVDPTVEVTFRTVEFQISTHTVAGGTPSAMSFAGHVLFYNCIFKVTTGLRALPCIRHSNQLRIANCIVHNPYYQAISSQRPSLYITLLGGIDFVYNNYVIGPWYNTFPTGIATCNHIDPQSGSALNLENYDTYYPYTKDLGIISGNNATDLDGTPIAVGLYGGQYAAMFRKAQYPIDQMPVFKYSYHTLYAPIIDRFVSITPLLGFTPPIANCHVYGAVSFNGGHDWLAWDEFLGGWKRIANLETLDVNGNLADDLCTRLVNNGPITTKGEICFAWALKSGNPDYTPNMRGVQMTVKANADTITPIHPEDLNVWIADDTVMVTNLSGEKMNDVVMVAY